MTDEEVKDIPQTWDDTTLESWADTIEDTKQQLAEAYLLFLDQQKWWAFATGAWLWVNLNPLQKDAIEYLTTETAVTKKTDIFSTIGKNIEKNIKKKFIETFTWWTLIEYDKAKLNKMKALIVANKDNQTKLQELITQIQAGTDPTIDTLADDKTKTPVVVPVVTPESKVEYTDKTNRDKVITALDAILAKDAKTAIPYVWWGKDIETQWGVDCSWLLYDTIKDAWLNEKLFSSRSAFLDLETKLVELDADKKIKKDGLENIQKWDFIFWNSTNPKYSRSAGEIPTITKDNKDYRIHHIAFIDKINYDDGTIDVVESNGSEGVTKSTVDVNYWLTTTDKHVSELYVAHVNYDTFAPVTAAL